MFAVDTQLGHEPTEYVQDEQGQYKAGFLGHRDPNNPNRFILEGEEGYDESLAKPALTPSALEGMDRADAELAVQAEKQEKQRKAGIAKVEAKKDQGILDEILKQEKAGEDSFKPGMTTKEAAKSVYGTVKKMTDSLVTGEINSMVEHLTSEENMLIFGREMAEAMVQIGDGLTQMATGVRGEEPSFVPTSIYEALQSVGKEREAALMRLSVGTMAGHWFPKGTSVESMKAQIPLLTHTQNMDQKERHWVQQIESGNMKAMLDYRSKMLGFKIDVEEKHWMREYKNRLFAHTREKDAYTYSLEKAKLDQENLGNIKLDRLELETINALKTTMDMGKEVLREKSKYNTGWFKNWWQSLGNYGGWADPAWHAFKQKVTFQLNTYVNNLTGKQLSKHEVARLKGVVPQMLDDDAVFRAKAKTFIKISQMMLNRKLKTYALNGHDVRPFEMDQDIHYKLPGGGERTSTLTSFGTWLRRNPDMLGKVKLLSGPQGKVLRPGEDYLADTLRLNGSQDNFIIKGPDGKWRYNSERYGEVKAPGYMLQHAGSTEDYYGQPLPGGHSLSRGAARVGAGLVQ